MKIRSCTFVAGGIALAMILIAGVAHAVEPYDVEVYGIAVKNLKTGKSVYAEGDTLQVDCNWSVTKAAAGSTWPPMGWNYYVKVDGTKIHESTTMIAPPSGPKISYGFGWSWVAKSAGAHTVTCGLGNPKVADTNLKNNEKSQVIRVTAPLKAQTPAGPVAAVPGGPVLPKPKLFVTGVQVGIEPNCQSPKPAMTANVTIKNSGGPLAASQGSVFVKEFGGANLGSAGIELPSFDAGQSRTIAVPAISLQSYNSLAGKHDLQAILNPVQSGGKSSFEKPAPYAFAATFPAGHCAKTAPSQQQRSPSPK